MGALPINRVFAGLSRAAKPGLGRAFTGGLWGGFTAPFRSDIPGMLERAAVGGMPRSARGLTAGFLRSSRRERFGMPSPMLGGRTAALSSVMARGGGADLATRQTSAMIGAGVGLLGMAKLASSVTGISMPGMLAFGAGHFYGTKGWMGRRGGERGRGKGFLTGAGAAIGFSTLF